jgi:hypothetical protein
MRIRSGDILGLCGEISGHRVTAVGDSYNSGRGVPWATPTFLLDDGRWVQLSDVHVVRTDNGDGTATETFSDGRVREVELE